MRPLRKARGLLLRVVLNRRLAIGVGVALALPGVWLWLTEFRWENSWTDGFALVAMATGCAIALAGLGGRRPDWIDDSPASSDDPRGR